MLVAAELDVFTGVLFMGWLGRLLTRVSGEIAEELTFVQGLSAGETRNTVPVAPDKCYLELYVDSLRIEKARAFATRFHGVVYCYVTLARLGESNSVVAADRLARPWPRRHVENSRLSTIAKPFPTRAGAAERSTRR